MNPALMPRKGVSGDQRSALKSDEERRMRREMRLDPKTWVKKTTRTLPPQLLRGALLLTGGFCLGWGAFRFWHN